MFYKKKYKKALEEINFMKEMYDKNAKSDNTNLKIQMLDLRRENEELKFKLNQKEDLGEVISKIRKVYISNFDKDLHKQYIELVKLYNRIGE
jgi:glycerophosphoryl diester phosphodiesterase